MSTRLAVKYQKKEETKQQINGNKNEVSRSRKCLFYNAHQRKRKLEGKDKTKMKKQVLNEKYGILTEITVQNNLPFTIGLIGFSTGQEIKQRSPPLNNRRQKFKLIFRSLLLEKVYFFQKLNESYFRDLEHIRKHIFMGRTHSPPSSQLTIFTDLS